MFNGHQLHWEHVIDLCYGRGLRPPYFRLTSLRFNMCRQSCGQPRPPSLAGGRGHTLSPLPPRVRWAASYREFSTNNLESCQITETVQAAFIQVWGCISFLTCTSPYSSSPVPLLSRDQLRGVELCDLHKWDSPNSLSLGSQGRIWTQLLRP